MVDSLLDSGATGMFIDVEYVLSVGNRTQEDWGDVKEGLVVDSDEFLRC